MCAAPRVRAFAELALKEIGFMGSLGEDSNGNGTGTCTGTDKGLLADKYAFSRFMDRVNERYGVDSVVSSSVATSCSRALVMHARWQNNLREIARKSLSNDDVQ